MTRQERACRTRAFAAAAAGVLVVGLSGCSGNSSSASPGPATRSGQTARSSTHEAPTTTSSPPPTAASNAPATEFNPPGDIPDNTVYVPYRLTGTKLVLTVPEGWARSSRAGAVTFTDKLNSITIQDVSASKAPTVASARVREVPGVAKAASKFAMGNVISITRKAGTAILVTYQQDSAPDQVTGKVVRDAVERYEFWHAGQEAILTLTGPTNADNVDPWRIVSNSLHWV